MASVMRTMPIGMQAIRAASVRSAAVFPSALVSQRRTGATLVDTPTSTHEVPEAVENTVRDTNARKIFKDAVSATAPRQSWTRDEISAIYYQPLMELTHQAVSAGACHISNVADFCRALFTAASTVLGKYSCAHS